MRPAAPAPAPMLPARPRRQSRARIDSYWRRDATSCQSLCEKLQCTSCKCVHIRDAIVLTGRNCRRALAVAGHGDARTSRWIAVASTRGTGGAGFSNAPVGCEPFADDARPDLRIALGRRLRAGELFVVEILE